MPTQAELIATFRAETEDLFKALDRQIYFNNGVAPYATTAEAISVIGAGWTAYLTVNVAGVEYWFLPDGSLVNKLAYLAIPDNSVALSKLVNMATASVFYRKTAGAGPPEVQTLATLSTDLGLTTMAANIAAKVTAVAGSSLVTDVNIAKIHDRFAADEAAVIAAIQLSIESIVTTTNDYTSAEKAKLAALNQNVFSINLPSASTVTGRLVGAVAPANFPTGWTLAADEGDLIITHSLNRKIAHVSVFSKNLLIERQLFGNAAYSGIYQNYLAVYNNVVIESLATILTDITIQLVFA